MEETIFISLLQNINFTFIAIVCLVTYGITETIQGITKCTMSRNAKSIISLIVGGFTMWIYLRWLNVSNESVLLSFLICTFGYDLLLKPIFKKIKGRFVTEK